MRCLAAENDADREHARSEIVRMLSAPPAGEGVEYEVRRILLDIGVPEHIKGHRYLVAAVCATVRNPNLADAITKELYPMIAEEFQTTAPRAERAIRHAIELAWDRGDFDTLQRYFGNTVNPCKGKPTNGEFIARVANVVRRYTK